MTSLSLGVLKADFLLPAAEVGQGHLLALLSCGLWLFGVVECDAEQALFLCVWRGFVVSWKGLPLR